MKQKHITYDERLTIEALLNDKASFRSIAVSLSKDPSTISREIRHHLIFRRIGSMHMSYNACLHRKSCMKSKICSKLLKPPYVCNGCPQRTHCSLEKRFYRAADAHKEYRTVLSESRSGCSLTEEEIRHLDQLISPLNRTYADYLQFMKEHPDTPVVQLDSVEGIKAGKVLLTIHFVRAEMMLAFLRDYNDSQSVIDVFNHLYEILGPSVFRRLFRLCLADNGTEFSNPKAIEFDDTGLQRTRVFYCDPSSPHQKGSAERNHEFIRCFVPKGKPFDPLTQEDIDVMMNNINSYCRESLGDKSPYDIFAFLLLC